MDFAFVAAEVVQKCIQSSLKNSHLFVENIKLHGGDVFLTL